MKVLFVASYYYPYISGLTIYAKKLAEGLASRGHKITVLTNQHQINLKRKENVSGIMVKRAKPLIRLSRGFIAPQLLLDFLSDLPQTKIVGLHLPIPEAFILAPLAKILGKKVFLIYHANLNLPSWLVSSSFIENIVLINHIIAGVFADKIIASSQDYVNFAKFLKIFRKKTILIHPPVWINKASKKEVKSLKKKWMPFSEKIIGFAGRFAEEKGGDILIEALPDIIKKIPKVKIVLAGEYKNLIYEDFYQRKRKLINKYRNHLIFLGSISPEKMANFYSTIDVLALPSRAEGFPLAPIEAMLSGCPVVGFDIPGGRIAIQLTGMGKIAGPVNSQNLAEAIVEVLKNRKKYVKPRREIEKILNYQKTLADYEKLFSAVP